jgi:hypothetical protein
MGVDKGMLIMAAEKLIVEGSNSMGVEGFGVGLLVPMIISKLLCVQCENEGCKGRGEWDRLSSIIERLMEDPGSSIEELARELGEEMRRMSGEKVVPFIDMLCTKWKS